jgi:hypothetical protein
VRAARRHVRSRPPRFALANWRSSWSRLATSCRQSSLLTCTYSAIGILQVCSQTNRFGVLSQIVPPFKVKLSRGSRVRTVLVLFAHSKQGNNENVKTKRVFAILLAASAPLRRIFGPPTKSSPVLFAFSLSSFCSVTLFTDQASFDAAAQAANLSDFSNRVRFNPTSPYRALKAKLSSP